MTWFKIDDAFWSHPKTMLLSPDAIALWVRAGSWSCHQLTDGVIPDRSLPLFSASSFAVEELVEAGFWFEVDGGHAFHDWDEYQETSEAVKARRARARDRMKVVRANRTRTDDERSQERAGEVRDSFERSSLNPDPTRPDHSSTKSEASRGTRVPRSFAITDEMREWASKEAPSVDIDSKLKEFIDYWSAVPGQKGVKLDWVATWRNGMRKQQGFAELDRPKVGAKDPDAWMQPGARK